MELTDFVDKFQTIAYEGYGKHKIIIKDKNGRIFNDENIKIYKNDKDKTVEIIFQEHDDKKVNDMNELEKENAELKEKLNKIERKCKFNFVDLLHDVENESKQEEQITKATKIIKELARVTYADFTDGDYSNELSKVLEQAEQFLKEIKENENDISMV